MLIIKCTSRIFFSCVVESGPMITEVREDRLDHRRTSSFHRYDARTTIAPFTSVYNFWISSSNIQKVLYVKILFQI